MLRVKFAGDCPWRSADRGPRSLRAAWT